MCHAATGHGVESAQRRNHERMTLCPSAAGGEGSGLGAGGRTEVCPRGEDHVEWVPVEVEHPDVEDLWPPAAAPFSSWHPRRLGRSARPQGRGLGCRSSRRRDCHFADILSSSLLKHLLKGEGGGRMTVSPLARVEGTDMVELAIRVVAQFLHSATATARCEVRIRVLQRMEGNGRLPLLPPPPQQQGQRGPFAADCGLALV